MQEMGIEDISRTTIRQCSMLGAALEEKAGEKFSIGCFYQIEAMDYDTAYDQVIERAGGASK